MMQVCQMLTIETTMMLAKRILTAGVFSMATLTSVMMNVTV